MSDPQIEAAQIIRETLLELFQPPQGKSVLAEIAEQLKIMNQNLEQMSDYIGESQGYTKIEQP